MAELDTIAEKVFSLLKGNGLKIKIFDVDGNEVTDPSTGRRFFINNPNIMVTIDEESNEIEMSRGSNVDGEQIDKLQQNMRRIADLDQMNFSTKVFGKSIQPRDYAYQAKKQKDTPMMENDSYTPGYIKYEQMKDKISGVLIKLYDQGKDEETIKQMGDRIAIHLGYNPEDSMFKDAFMSLFADAHLNGDFEKDDDDYTDYSMRQGEMGNPDRMMENNAFKPHNHQLLGKVLHKVRFFGGSPAYTIADDLGLPLSDVQPILNKLVTDGKLSAEHNAHGEIEYSAAVDEAIMEVSTEKLAKYKTAAGADARKADAEGDYKRGDKRFSGIVKATKKQFANDAKPKQTESVLESFSRMFGSAKTSQQTLENVRILVRHKVPVSEEVRGSRSRHISAIFLECNGERMRFKENYLPGARAMAQHLAHGGAMTDKVGMYISESTSQLLKLQSFNRYVTTNKLINEDSSGIVETVKENIQTLRTELKKLTGSKTYETIKARLETFEREALAEDDTSGLKELFTIRRFDEKFEEVLPIVKQLVQEKDTYHKRIEEAASNVVVLRREALSAAPIFEFASDNARLGFKINELSLRISENEELAGFVNKIGTKLCKEGVVNDFERAVLTQVLENMKVVDTTPKKQDMTESFNIESFFDRYTLNFM